MERSTAGWGVPLGPQRRGELVLLLTAAVWGTSFIAVQAVNDAVGPLALLALRMGIGTLVLLPLVRPGALGRRVWQQGAALGACLFAGFGLQSASLMYTTAAHTAFGTALVTILVPALTFVVWRHRWPAGNYAALVASLWGTGCLMGFARGAPMQLGDLLSIVCALAFAVHIVLLNRASRESEMMPLLVAQLGCAFVLASLAWGLAGAPLPALSWDHWQVLATVAYLGVMTTALCALGQIYGQARTSSTRVAFILALEPVFAAAFAYVVQGQRLSTSEWLGGSLIVGAALVADRSVPTWLQRWRRRWQTPGH